MAVTNDPTRPANGVYSGGTQPPPQSGGMCLPPAPQGGETGQPVVNPAISGEQTLPLHLRPEPPSVAQLEADARQFQGIAANAFESGKFPEAVTQAGEAIKKLESALIQGPDAQTTQRILGASIACSELEALAQARTGAADDALRQFAVRVNTIFPPPAPEQISRKVRAWWRFGRTAMSLGMQSVANSAYHRSFVLAINSRAVAVADTILADQSTRLFAHGYDTEARGIIAQLVGLREQARRYGVIAGDPNAARGLSSQIEQVRLTLPNQVGGRWTPTDTPAIINYRLQAMAADLLQNGFPQFAAEILTRLARFQTDTHQSEAYDTINLACNALDRVRQDIERREAGNRPALAEATDAQRKLRVLQAGISRSQAQTEMTPPSVPDHVREAAMADEALREGVRRSRSPDPKLPAPPVLRQAAALYIRVGNYWQRAGKIEPAVEAYIRHAIAEMAAEGGTERTIQSALNDFIEITNRLFPDRTLLHELQTAHSRRADTVMELGRRALSLDYPDFATSAMRRAITLYEHFGLRRPQISAMVEIARVFLSTRYFHAASHFYQQAHNLMTTQNASQDGIRRAIIEPAMRAVEDFCRTNSDQALQARARQVGTDVQGLMAPVKVAPVEAARPTTPRPSVPIIPEKAAPAVQETPPPIPLRRDPPPTPPTSAQVFYEDGWFCQAAECSIREANAAAATQNFDGAISARMQSVRAGIRADTAASVSGNYQKGGRAVPTDSMTRFTLRSLDQFLGQFPDLRPAALQALRYMLSSPDVRKYLEFFRKDYSFPEMRVGGEVVKVDLSSTTTAEPRRPSPPSSSPPPASSGGVNAGGTTAKKAATPQAKGNGGGNTQRVALGNLGEHSITLGGVLGTAFLGEAAHISGLMNDKGYTLYGAGSLAAMLWAFPTLAIPVTPFAIAGAGLAESVAKRNGVENPYVLAGIKIGGGAIGAVPSGAIFTRIIGRSVIAASDAALKSRALSAIEWGGHIMPTIIRAAGVGGRIIARRAVTAGAAAVLPIGGAVSAVILAYGLIESGMAVYEAMRE